jgi:hypothetical protein
MIATLAIAIAGAAIFGGLKPMPASGQDSNEALASAAANPLANLISLPFQNNTNFGIGSFDRTANVLNIQPVIPLFNGRVITRTIAPVVWIPDVTAESGTLSSGLGDILFTAFYSPASEGVVWGFGPVVSLPTGGETRGSDRWGLGPSAVLVATPANWTIGVLANNVWSLGSDSEAADVNQGLLQYFVVYTMEGGWYVNSAPIITADWEAGDGQKWTVPFGAGAGKVFRIGSLPINSQVGAYYNVVKPDNGPNWQLRVQVQFLFPFGG